MRQFPTLLLSSLLGVIPAAHADSDADIDKGNRDWSIGMTHADPGLVADAYAADAVFCDAKGACTTGHDAIEKRMAERLKSGAARSAEAHSIRRIAEDGFVYEWGEASLVDAAGHAGHAHYFTVWVQTGGRWRIFRNLVLP